MIKTMDGKAAVVGYMCMTDYRYELGERDSGNMVYKSVEELKHMRPCVKECGIIEVEIKATRVVQDRDW